MSKLVFINKKFGEQSTIALFFFKMQHDSRGTIHVDINKDKVNQISIISLAYKLILTHANTLFFF